MEEKKQSKVGETCFHIGSGNLFDLKDMEGKMASGSPSTGDDIASEDNSKTSIPGKKGGSKRNLGVHFS